jgi:hypothetical protein
VRWPSKEGYNAQADASCEDDRGLPRHASELSGAIFYNGIDQPTVPSPEASNAARAAFKGGKKIEEFAIAGATTSSKGNGRKKARKARK